MVSESGSTIEDSVMNVVSNIFTGAILSILVMFVFLKNVGLTGVIAVSMPISIIGTFVFLRHNTEYDLFGRFVRRCRYAGR